MSHRHLDPAALPREWGDALGAVQDALSTQTEDECPVCAGVAVLGEHGPWALDRIAKFASGLAGALREMAPVAGTGDESGEVGPEGGDRGTVPSHRPPPPTTVRIDVSD